MSCTDRAPLQGTPTTARISARCNNRLGAVYSALYAFWSTRAAIQGQAAQATIRRDAYSVILFDKKIVIPIENDFHSSPDQLLDTALSYRTSRGTNYTIALSNTQTIMEKYWSTDRYVYTTLFSQELRMKSRLHFRSPVVIFLSDGECSVNDSAIQDVSRRALALG
jgi:hypothetical protein